MHTSARTDFFIRARRRDLVASRAMSLRIGILGAAKIAGSFMVGAKASSRVAVVAIASRDRARAEAFARHHDIPRAYGYTDLLADREGDAIYNPLPNSLHAEWSIAAARAGKHVLCEKPIAASEPEAEAMFAAADDAGVVLLEAFPRCPTACTRSGRSRRRAPASTCCARSRSPRASPRPRRCSPRPTTPAWCCSRRSPAAQQPAGGVVDRGGARRQARAVREADRRERARGRGDVRRGRRRRRGAARGVPPLPNSLQAEWSIAAARAGKHVLCEKPIAASEPE